MIKREQFRTRWLVFITIHLNITDLWLVYIFRYKFCSEIRKVRMTLTYVFRQLSSSPPPATLVGKLFKTNFIDNYFTSSWDFSTIYAILLQNLLWKVDDNLFACLKTYPLNWTLSVTDLKRYSAHKENLRHNTGWHKKTGTFENPNKNWRNPRKNIYWQKLNHYNLPFKRQ